MQQESHCSDVRIRQKGLPGHETLALDTEDWKKVFWTDESKFEIFGSCRIFARHRVGLLDQQSNIEKDV